MHRKTLSAMLVVLAFSPAWAPAQDDGASADDGRQWDHAQTALKAMPAGDMAFAISRWKLLTSNDTFLFVDYASFVMTYPGLPEETKLRGFAEKALERSGGDPRQIVAFFERFAPLSNPARAQFALALYALGRPQAESTAREAWRGGAMSDEAETALFGRIGASLSAADRDERMEALLWSNSPLQAERALAQVSEPRRPVFSARYAMMRGIDPFGAGADAPAGANADPGYVYNRSRFLRSRNQIASAVALHAYRPRFATPPRDPRKWLSEVLTLSRKADADGAARLAGSLDDMFAAGTDVSLQAYAIRDDYTSVMWLGGTKALWTLGDGLRAAPLFYRYGAAARTPQTRAKGFYWAGRAMFRAGKADEAARYFRMAAQYTDNYYGMLALERLGQPLPSPASSALVEPSAAERSAFEARALTKAVREVARESDWPTAVRFFKEIAEQAETEADHVLVADLARTLGRRDLGVILGQAAHVDGHGNYRKTSYPLIPTPPGSNWTMIHAISRQESQFALNALSHAGARGLMQLMPRTAREQAGKMGFEYDLRALTQDAGYNLTLGDGYFRRMLDYYAGSYPLAVAAYNAGPGNVNNWLAANGDPRAGGVDWVDWVERIPIQETRNYVQRVLENAIVYEALYPNRASYRGTNPLSHFLGKSYPG